MAGLPELPLTACCRLANHWGLLCTSSEKVEVIKRREALNQEPEGQIPVSGACAPAKQNAETVWFSVPQRRIRIKPHLSAELLQVHTEISTWPRVRAGGSCASAAGECGVSEMLGETLCCVPAKSGLPSASDLDWSSESLVPPSLPRPAPTGSMALLTGGCRGTLPHGLVPSL